MIRDEELSAERLAAEVGGLLGDEARLAAMAAASAALAKPDAARRIADEVLAAARHDARAGDDAESARLGFAPAALHRHRRRRDERPGAGLRASSARRSRGSDRADSSYMERLRAAGLEPAVGHDAANLPEGAEVVVSTAIGEDNPELALARERGLAIRSTAASCWPSSAPRSG